MDKNTITIDEYCKILEEKYNKTNWNSKQSIHMYNEYVRLLRELLEEE